MNKYYYVCFFGMTYDGRKVSGARLIDIHPLKWVDEIKEISTITFWEEVSKEIWEEFKEKLK